MIRPINLNDGRDAMQPERCEPDLALQDGETVLSCQTPMHDNLIV